MDLIAVGEADWFGSLDEVKTQVLLGKTLVLVDGSPKALLLESRESPARAVEEPAQERIIQGPREGFTELLKINLALVRRRLPTPTLKIKFMEIGRRTSTNVALLYLDDVADSDLVEEVWARLEAIDIDGILEPGAIGELISERKWSPFPLILNTERPDKVAGELLQGKVILLAEGSPFAKIMPATFADFNHTPEDFYIHPVFATLTRTQIIDELAMIFGMGIDEVEGEPELLQITIVNPSFAEGADEPTTINTVRAYSLNQALINLQHQKAKQPVFGKLDVFIFSEDVARSGAMHQILRQYDQSRDTNPRVFLCIVRGATAQEVLNLSLPQEPRTAVFLGSMLRQNLRDGRSPEINAINYWVQYNTPGIANVIPVIELTGPEDENKGLLLAGLAVIDEGGRMKGYFSDAEMLIYMLLSGNIQRGRFYTHVDYMEQKNRVLTSFIQKSSVKVESKIVQGKVVIDIKADLILDGLNVDLVIDTQLKEEFFSGLEQALARDLQGNIRRVLKKSQEWEADIVGLGQHVRVQHPKWFREKDWASEYRQSEINVEVKVTIKRFSTLVNPNY